MRALPVIAHFQDDPACARYFSGVQRFRRMLVEEMAAEPLEGERVVLVSNEAILERHYNQLRVPNVRVLAFSDQCFHESRNDGAVYAYLPSNARNRSWNEWWITPWTTFTWSRAGMRLTSAWPMPQGNS